MPNAPDIVLWSQLCRNNMYNYVFAVYNANFVSATGICRYSHDVTKLQSSKQLILRMLLSCSLRAAEN